MSTDSETLIATEGPASVVAGRDDGGPFLQARYADPWRCISVTLDHAALRRLSEFVAQHTPGGEK